MSSAVVRIEQFEKAERGEIFGDDADPFGVVGVGLTWQSKREHFAVRRAGRLVAHTGLITLPISVGAVRAEVVGVGGVAVAPDHRGQGLARLVMAAALEHARTLGPQHGLLFCRPPLVPLYQGLGWHELQQDVRVEQPGGPVTMPLRSMWTPLHDGAQWPAGPVHLLALPM
ncbi:GNAT family N-acetyltransferase [Kitasatospora kazusensis]